MYNENWRKRMFPHVPVIGQLKDKPINREEGK